MTESNGAKKRAKKERARAQRKQAAHRQAASKVHAPALPPGMTAADLGLVAALGDITWDVIDPEQLGLGDCSPAEMMRARGGVLRALRNGSGNPAAFDKAYRANLAGAARTQVEMEATPYLRHIADRLATLPAGLPLPERARVLDELLAAMRPVPRDTLSSGTVFMVAGATTDGLQIGWASTRAACDECLDAYRKDEHVWWTACWEEPAPARETVEQMNARRVYYGQVLVRAVRIMKRGDVQE